VGGAVVALLRYVAHTTHTVPVTALILPVTVGGRLVGAVRYVTTRLLLRYARYVARYVVDRWNVATFTLLLFVYVVRCVAVTLIVTLSVARCPLITI